MRSKKRTIGILIVVIVVLLGFAGSLLVYRNKLSSENNSDVYTAVDKEIYEKIVNDAFKNASLEERKEIALNVLNTLESENKIKKDSIKFNDEYNCYFFLYSNGAEGSIILDDCFSSLETNNNINEDNSKNDSIFDIEKGNFEKSISSNYFNKTYIESGNNNANGYIKENLSTYNLTYYPKSALIIDCMDNDYERNLNNVLSQTWTTNDLKTDVRSNVTVEEFKTILNGSDGHSGYDFINIDAHGFIDYNGNPTVFLQEEMNPFENNYSDDRDAKRIGTIFGFLGGEYYLKYNFFEYYYYNALTDEIIWLSCCKGYTNDILVGTLANDCNAKAVIGLTDTVIADYDNRMRDFFIHKLLFGYTVNESLKEAKSVYGKDDAEWYLRKYNKKDNTPAECKNYNGGDETLVELVSINTNGMLSGTVTDESNNPIKDAEIIINNVRGMSHEITATTNENGEYTLECPQDSYKIGVKADGYEVFETDDFVNVVYGEENIFNITLKKVIEPTDHIETTLNYTAVDLIEKNIPEIISLMNGEYQIIKTENDGYIYIQNQSVLSGMEFYVQVSGDDIISANNGEEIHSDTLKAKLESGELTLDGIQVNKAGKVSNTIQAGMDYKSCCKVLGDFDCIGGTGGYLGGSTVSVSHTYNEKNAKIILHFFNIPSEIMHDLSLGKISSVSSEQMKSYNPKLENVVIRKAETITTNATEPPTESPTKLPTEPQTEPTSELKIETGKLSDSDIKSEWQHVISLDFEYSIFKTDDKDLKEFLDTSVTNEILSYMATDSDYNLFISGGFEYDMSIDGYLSIDGWINNHPEGGQGYLGCENYTFFVDLKNRKVLSLNDLFSESEDLVYNEIREKADKYISDKRSYLMNPDALINYDYEKCKFLLTKDKLTLIFSPYEISVGAVGSVEIEIPVSDINLTCVVPEVETNGF